MLTEEKVIELLSSIQDPYLHKSMVDSGSIRELKIKEGYVGLKIGLAHTGTPEQMQLQQQIVQVLKNAGVESVGLRFEKRDDVQTDSQPQQQQQTGATTLLSENSKTEFIAIASGKGGVGKSTVSVNLAVALARLGKKVGLIDADIYGFSVPDMMGITERPKVKGDRIFPVERFGVKVISMAFFVEDNAPVIWRGPMLGKMLMNFFSEVEWGDLDYVLLDLPPGTGDVALDVHKMLPKCKEVIVTTPHATAAFVAARAGTMAIKTNHEVLGIVENMAYFQSESTGEKEYVFGKDGGKRLAEELNVPLLGQIPLGQPEIKEDDFAPSVYEQTHPIGEHYINMAKTIIEKTK
ncbi:chromosome partitioning protein ParA [Fictibacillus arsenicus]|uniref:Iron-sulfur cluster carrier protein n=1 Tax=Fictibacillus arsenicus TaxID=255247 RepID=A0A1B1YZM8_9BACL|nr:Mrp/NBP35 family ATP-binding protein [Fictibacillus arsenicus]ANX10579.1 chromosome partitioning protein ParA [Fictibacillus arsenicus]